MGWISQRAMNRGTGLATGNKRSIKDKAPLKKIMYMIRPRDGLFDQDRVMLECGHDVKSNGQYRARCWKCLLEQQEREKE